MPIYLRVIAISNGFTAKLLKDPSVLLCTGFGVGFLPRVPGTWGSLLGIGLWWVVFHELGPAVSILVVGLAIGFAWLVIRQTCRAYNVEDEPAIVIDEIVGMLLTFVFLNVGFVTMVFGFVLFRVFDIVKPYPARACERLPGGWGVMADDVVAGLYAQAVLRGGIWMSAALGI